MVVVVVLDVIVAVGCGYSCEYVIVVVVALQWGVLYVCAPWCDNIDN